VDFKERKSSKKKEISRLLFFANHPSGSLYQGGWGDFRDGLTKQDFLANFKFSYFDPPRDESRTFRTKPNFDSLVRSQKYSLPLIITLQPFEKAAIFLSISPVSKASAEIPPFPPFEKGGRRGDFKKPFQKAKFIQELIFGEGPERWKKGRKMGG
jgi:hypothetical protein